MQAVNKWNKHVYKVVKIEGRKVTLERENGKQFTIDKSEYYFTYIEKEST